MSLQHLLLNLTFVQKEENPEVGLRMSPAATLVSIGQVLGLFTDFCCAIALQLPNKTQEEINRSHVAESH